MNPRSLVLAAATAVGVLGTVAACYEDDPTSSRPTQVNTSVLLTDAPFPYDSVGKVEIFVVRISAKIEEDTSSNEGWVTIAEPNRRIDILALSHGVTDSLGGADLAGGQYRALRMVIDTDQSHLYTKQGRELPVDWQSSAGRPALHAFVEAPLAVNENGQTAIVIDFDVGRSFLCANDVCDHFIFLPTMRAVNRAGTGTVSGQVLGDTLSELPQPIAFTTVTVYSGDPARPENTWSVRATARTDAQGSFRIAFLMPGTYILRADAPRASTYSPGVRAGITVVAGREISGQDIVLPGQASEGVFVTPDSIVVAVGASARLSAEVRDVQGTPVPGALVSWATSDSSIVTVAGARDNSATVRGLAVGLASVRAQYGMNAGLARVVVVPAP